MNWARILLSLLVIFTLAVSSISFVRAVELTISADKAEYELGDLIVVSGKTDPNKVVSLQLFNPSGELVAIGQLSADPNGNFRADLTRFPAATSQRFPLGDYTVKATVEGATTEQKIRLKQGAPPPPPPAPTGTRVTVETIPDRYIFTNRFGQLTYRIEVFRLEPKITVAVESTPGVFDEINKVGSKLTRLIEFIDVDNNNEYQPRTDTDVKRIDAGELAWTNLLLNQSIRKWQYTAVLKGIKDALNVNLNVTIAGGDGNATVTLRVAGFTFGNPNSKLAGVWEGKASKELDMGPGEFGINIRKDTTFTSPFHRLEANGVTDGNSIAFRSRMVEESEDIHEGDTQKIVFLTIPRFTTSATHKSMIGARVGVPVPEFPPIGVVLAFVVLISAVFIMRRKGLSISPPMPRK